MFKLTMTVMGSVFLGLSFATLCKAESGAESSPTGVPQTTIQRLINLSLSQSLEPVLKKLQELEQKIKGNQSYPSSDKENQSYPSSDKRDQSDPADDKQNQSYPASDEDPPCRGPLCQPESSRDRYRDRYKGSPCWSSNCEVRDRSPCEPSTCELLRERGSPCWPSGCREKEWPCHESCRHERPRNADIHIYKHIYLHKHVYKHVHYYPLYPPAYPPAYPPFCPPCWDCDW